MSQQPEPSRLVTLDELMDPPPPYQPKHRRAVWRDQLHRPRRRPRRQEAQEAEGTA
jgi:hypothetical protein